MEACIYELFYNNRHIKRNWTRTQDQATFPSAQLFGMAKDAGMLTTPEETAQQIIAFLFTEHFEHGAIVDIYDYSKLQQHVDTQNKNN